MTYSIVARDSDGSVGVAVQSHWFDVRRSVPWTRYGAGAVAIQAISEPALGMRGLDLLSAGASAAEVVESLLVDDPLAESRQLAVVGTQGGAAARTGDHCLEHASQLVGESWVALGNLLAGPAVVDALVEAYLGNTGDLADRLLAGLAAAQAAGGDIRGQQSAAMIVVPNIADETVRREEAVDLSVADHEAPVTELGRLIAIDRGYRDLRRSRRAERDGDIESALEHLMRHSGEGPPEVELWRAVGLERMGHGGDALPVLARALGAQQSLLHLLRRLAVVDEDAARLVARLD